MGDLEQVVEDLAGGVILAVRMFQKETTIFLNVETLVLDLPTQPSSLVGQRVDIVGGGDEVGQSLEGGGAGISPASWSAFFAHQHIQIMVAILAITISDLPGPMQLLCDLLLRPQADLLMGRGLGTYQLIGAVNLGQICILQGDQVTPVVVSAELEGWTACKEPIQQQADRQMGQTIECFQLTVLLIGLWVRILDELGHQRECKAIGGHQFGFQHRMVVECLPIVELPGQTIFAMAVLKCQHPGIIDGHKKIAVQPPAIQNFLADQGRCMRQTTSCTCSGAILMKA